MGQNLEEFFDVVDGQDRVTGRARRREVHAAGLRHRAVHVLLRNRAGEFFLQRRSELKDSAPGCWDSSCSGHVDSGENYRPAAARECGEELGLAKPPEFWPVVKLPAGPETGQEFVWVYEGRAEGPFTLHPEEIQDGRWWRPEDLEREIAARPERFSRCFRAVWAARRNGQD